MAHQAHNIPWGLLASNLRWEAPPPGTLGFTDLKLLNKPKQAKNLSQFCEAFAKNLQEHALDERRRYPAQYDPPKPEDVIISDSAAQKIGYTVLNWRSSYYQKQKWPLWRQTCEHSEPCTTCPVLPLDERRAAAFLREHEATNCHGLTEESAAAFFNLEVSKTLLLFGEMEPLLRVSAHPDNDLKNYWTACVCYCNGYDLGWDILLQPTLTAYIGLNLAYCFPEIYDTSYHKPGTPGYRDAAFYQYALRECTRRRDSAVGAYPHQQFFGISGTQFGWRSPDIKAKYHWLKDHWRPRDINSCDFGVSYDNHYGLLPFHEFILLENDPEFLYRPSTDDAYAVLVMLCSKGLPVEISTMVMSFAHYQAPKGRLLVSDDPLHPSNREELGKYLKYCWQVLVRGHVLMNELGMGISWKHLVAESITYLLDTNRSGYNKWYEIDYEYEARLQQSQSAWTFL